MRAIACALAGLLLLAQLAVAAYVCPTGAAGGEPTGAASALAPNGSSAADASASHRCDDPGGSADETQPTLCAEHCRYGQQSDHAAVLKVPAAVLAPLYFVALSTAAPSGTRSATAHRPEATAASPPHAVLHCCYRI